MIESTLTQLSVWLSQTLWLALIGSFAWGTASILLSPCHLSSIPLVIGFIASRQEQSAGRAFRLSLIFSLGILVSIAVIGFITASAGRLMGDLGRVGNSLVAVVFFIFGLYLLDVLHINWSFNASGSNYKGIWGALALGLVFGIALGPCTFAFIAPVLGVVFTRAQTDYVGSLALMSAFAIGHCGVIVLAGTMSQKVQGYLNWSEKSKAVKLIKSTCGILVIIGGIYLLTK